MNPLNPVKAPILGSTLIITSIKLTRIQVEFIFLSEDIPTKEKLS